MAMQYIGHAIQDCSRYYVLISFVYQTALLFLVSSVILLLMLSCSVETERGEDEIVFAYLLKS